jgi:hypothetical protein
MQNSIGVNDWGMVVKMSLNLRIHHARHATVLLSKLSASMRLELGEATDKGEERLGAAK